MLPFKTTETCESNVFVVTLQFYVQIGMEMVKYVTVKLGSTSTVVQGLLDFVGKPLIAATPSKTSLDTSLRYFPKRHQQRARFDKYDFLYISVGRG